MWEKLLTKFNICLLIKTPNKVHIEGTYLNIIMTIYDNPIADSILSGENLNTFALK